MHDDQSRSLGGWLHPDQYQKMPWKNGRGVTEEILREPAQGEFQWRMSRATMTEATPFSRFDGYDRVLTVVDGEGIRINGEEVDLYKPYYFAGEVEVFAELINGPIVDIGVIYQRDLYSAVLRLYNGSFCELVPPNSIWFVHVSKGSWATPTNQVVVGSTAMFRAGDVAQMQTDGGVLVIVELKSKRDTGADEAI